MTQVKRKRIQWTPDNRAQFISEFDRVARTNTKDGLAVLLVEASKAMPEAIRRKYFSVDEKTWFSNRRFAVTKAEAQVKKTVAEVAPAPVVQQHQPPAQQRSSATLDIQMRALLQTELHAFEPVMIERLVSRMDSMLKGHELRIQAMLEASERRMLTYWGAPVPEEKAVVETPVDKTLQIYRYRILVAPLRKDQHQLVWKHLGDSNGMHELGIQQVAILEQDENLAGYSKENFDKVFLLTRFTGHSFAEKLQKRFGKDKVQSCNGAALTVAKEIKAWVASQSTD